MAEQLEFIRRILEWLPALALFVLAIELVDCVVVLLICRHRYRERRFCGPVPGISE